MSLEIKNLNRFFYIPILMYRRYQDTITEILSTESNFNNFKQMPGYTYMAEHVTHNLALYYLSHIWNEFQLQADDILAYSRANDALGNAVQYKFSDDLQCSPSSLRYIYHALVILNHIKKLGLQNVRIVEVGCAYGGLCLAINEYSKRMNISISEYTLIDLDEATLLQKKYLSYYKLSYPCKFYSSSNYGKELQGNDLFFISNYCFSEIDSTHQKGYLEHLVPKCSHGFLIWNNIPYYDIGKQVTIEDERPQTDRESGKNKFIFF